jgi:hypothetical protein
MAIVMERKEQKQVSLPRNQQDLVNDWICEIEKGIKLDTGILC